MDDRRVLSKRILAAALLLTASSLRAETLASKISPILENDQLKNADISVHVAEITAAGPVERFADHADLPLAPASNTKLITTAAAFEKYGSKANFKTSLYKVGDDLLIVGGGDPAFGDSKLVGFDAPNPADAKPTATLEAMAAELKKLGVTTFRDLIIDDRVFDNKFIHPAWPKDQLLSWYEAPVGGLNFNVNCVNWLPKLAGDKISLDLIPTNSYVTTTIKATKAGETKIWMYRPLTGNAFELRGTLAASARAAESVTILDPGLWTGTVARDTFLAAGITSTGQVRRLTNTDDMRSAAPVAAASTSLLTVLYRANKQSINMMAEALCKRLGHDATGQPGSWTNGTAAVTEYAKAAGVPAEQISLDDGSGLSAKNRISAKAFTTVLAHVAATADGETFVQTLAEPGEEGTLKRRFAGMTVAKSVHAKTGHITGVSTLSGYIDVPTANGKTRRFVFSILCNRYAGNVNPLQDQICQAIYDWAQKN